MDDTTGTATDSGTQLWQKAKELIPGGSMLLSKRAEMYLPQGWPAYFDRPQGCSIWDLDGREFTNVSLMGAGTNILGYSHPEVDQAVLETVRKGNLSTLNAPEVAAKSARSPITHCARNGLISLKQ